jgi:hypothetical protein
VDGAAEFMAVVRVSLGSGHILCHIKRLAEAMGQTFLFFKDALIGTARSVALPELPLFESLLCDLQNKSNYRKII